MYVIAWKSRATGHENRGSLRLSLDEAESVCHALNKHHPSIHHWPEAAPAAAE